MWDELSIRCPLGPSRSTSAGRPSVATSSSRGSYHGTTRCSTCLVELVAGEPEESLQAPERGIGTGNLAHRFLEAYPRATLLGIYLSEEMVCLAREKVRHFGERVTLRQAEIRAMEWPTGLDVILSAGVLHHLENGEKMRAFHAVSRALVPRGILLYADLIRPTGPTLQADTKSR